MHHSAQGPGEPQILEEKIMRIEGRIDIKERVGRGWRKILFTLPYEPNFRVFLCVIGPVTVCVKCSEKSTCFSPLDFQCRAINKAQFIIAQLEKKPLRLSTVCADATTNTFSVWNVHMIVPLSTSPRVHMHNLMTSSYKTAILASTEAFVLSHGRK